MPNRAEYGYKFRPEVLRRKRVQKQLTQQELASRAHLSVGQINRLERGAIKQPHFSTVRQLAEVLEIESDDLWEWKDEDS